MRSLTIKRAKKFTACLAVMKVYIEDPDSNELTIDGTPCRRLGELKNGEEKTFTIGEDAAKVFVIADKASRGWCFDYYRIEAGTEDIRLSGANVLDPGTGNAFRFDDNPNGPSTEQRAKSKRTGTLILIMSLILGISAGVIAVAVIRAGSAQKPKTFRSNGMTITLTNEFRNADPRSFTAVFDSKNAAVFVSKEYFSDAPGLEDLTSEEYAELSIRANGIENAERKNYDGTPGFEYSFTNPDTKEVYRYFTYTYKEGGAFWLVQFVTLEKNAEEYAPRFAKWAGSVVFSPER